MPLTPEDVSNKRFTTVRLREGYDMTEVDQFLDEVEAELSRLLKENEALRGGDAATPAGAASPAPAVGPTDAPAVDEPGPTVAVDAPAAAPEVPAQAVPVSEPAASGAAGRETLTVTTTAEASAAATRLLELAGRNADQLVEEAEQQAQQIVGEARTRAEQLDAETEQRRESLLSDIERQKAELTGQIDGLRAFEREYRAELRTYFEDQLAALEGQGAGGVLSHSDRDAVTTDVAEGPAGDVRSDDERDQHHDG